MINITNIKKKEINMFFKLTNGQWLKIIFSYKKNYNIWFETIVVANTKRQCNDCVRKTEHSPKILYGKITGRKLGLEALLISLKELLLFEKTVNNTQISIVGANKRLNNIYTYLKKYGYLKFSYTENNQLMTLMYKKINNNN